MRPEFSKWIIKWNYFKKKNRMNFTCLKCLSNILSLSDRIDIIQKWNYIKNQSSNLNYHVKKHITYFLHSVYFFHFHDWPNTNNFHTKWPLSANWHWLSIRDKQIGVHISPSSWRIFCIIWIGSWPSFGVGIHIVLQFRVAC